MENQKPVKLLIMENSKRDTSNILGIFDLKGSIVNRIVEGENFETA